MTRSRESRAAAVLGLVCCVLLMGSLDAASARADDTQLSKWLNGQLQIGVGVDYSTGDFDESVTTEMLFVPFSVGYLFDDFAVTPTRRDQLELKVSVPYLYIDGAITAGDTGRSREDGVGDVSLDLAYLYYPERTWYPATELKFRTKLPTANEKHGLGTGKTDYGLSLTLFQRYGDFVPFATGGYRFIGENNPEYLLRDGATASVGASWVASERLSFGVSYDWRQAISKRTEVRPRSHPRVVRVRADDAHEITLFASAGLGYGFRFAPYFVAGLADGSPDFAVGFQLTKTLPLRAGR